MQIVASSVAMGSAPVCAMAKPRCSIAAPRKGPFGTHFAAKPLKAIRTLEAKAMNVATQAASSGVKYDGTFIPVMRPEDLPKGTRKEIRVEGKSVLMFWYRNQIYAIEARSPAEGAYSEGFIRSKFTQDFAIECPSTGTLFSLKDGAILAWYPNNFVLRLLTPQDTCRALEIYPVKLDQEAISVDISNSMTRVTANSTKGGSDTSLENNNVYGLEPKVYVEGAGEEAGAVDATGSPVAKVLTTTVGVVAVVAVIAVTFALIKYISS